MRTEKRKAGPTNLTPADRARGGSARTEAKIAAARASVEKARAARFSKAQLGEMSRREMEMRATLAPSLRGKAVWVRRIAARGLTLTRPQKEILMLDAERKAAP